MTLARSERMQRLFEVPVRDGQTTLGVWNAVEACGVAAGWPAEVTTRLAVLVSELASLSLACPAAQQLPVLRVTWRDPGGQPEAFVQAGPLRLPRSEPLRALESQQPPQASALAAAASDWQVLGDDPSAAVVRASLALPAGTRAPDPSISVDTAGRADAVDPARQLMSRQHAAMLKLAEQNAAMTMRNAQLTKELDETNHGVVALYGELEDQANQLQQLNATLEQRVAERTAEAERRAQDLRALASQLSQVEHRERRRIAQILHDGLQQLLVASKMRLSVLQRRVDEEADAAFAEVQDLLDESISASRSLTVELAPPVLFNAGFKDALVWLAERIHDKHRVRVEVHGPEEDVELSDDLRTLVFQATQELLFNIVKHADTDSATVTLDPSQGQLRLTIADRGRGFDPGTSDLKPQSAGFGLLSVRERLKWYGGAVTIASRPGEGTQVSLTVPLGHTPEHMVPEESPTAASASADEPWPDENVAGAAPDRRSRILLADDHRLMREGLRSLIEAQPDMEIAGEASDGEEAVDLAMKIRPDIVLMDVNLPGIDGVEATRRIKDRRPEARIIGVSMHEAESVNQTMRRAGASGYVKKDSASRTLCQAIRRTLAASHTD